MIKKLIVFALAVTSLTSTAFAQGLDSYLADESDSALRVQIAVPPEERAAAQSWWGKLTSLLGIRKLERIKPAVGTKFTVQSSAYAPSPYQTDATPCITAAGTRVRPGVVASNFLPLGTLLDINGQEFIVEDRMNPRYSGYYLDIWFPSTSTALEFGRQKMQITIKGYGEPGQTIRKTAAEPVDKTLAREDDPSLWASVRENVALITTFLGARSGAEVNRFDVDCSA